MIESKELKYWLAWNKVKTIGPIRFYKLIKNFNSLEEAWNKAHKPDEIIRVLGIGRNAWDKIRQEKEKINPEEELNILQKSNINTITILEKDYPVMLKNIYNPPPIIYYKGDLISSLHQKKGFAIVGSRKSTYYGRKVAREIAAELSSYGFVIVSGLARGIDTNAHLGSLDSDGETIAVLGCSVDRIYPPENNKLANQIMENGAIISEFPLNTQPEKSNFPRRNRIISGLTIGTLVVEAAERSGALITADFALEQGRDVFAIPGNIHSFQSKGCHNLIKQGAKLVNCAQDILEEFTDASELFQSKFTKKENGQYLVELNENEKKLLKHISIEPLHIDELAELANIPYNEFNEVLLMLELKNLIKEIEGKRYIRIK